MGFQRPEAFAFLLVLVPLIWGLWRGNTLNRRVADVFKSQPPGRAYCAARLALASLFVASLTAVGAQPYAVPAVTGHYLFVVDVSRSMSARFACSQPSLLERSKDVMRKTLAGVPEGKFGIVAFERLAFPITQMTYDHEYLDEVITHALSVGLIYEQTATRLPNALAAVAEKKERLPGVYGRVSHIVLLTDGQERQRDEARLPEALMRLHEVGVRVLAVGIGDPAGVPIPRVVDGECAGGYAVADGKPILIALRPEPLQAIARATRGRYFGEAEVDQLVQFLRQRTLRDAPAHAGFGRLQRRDLSWAYLGLATAALFGMVLLAVHPRGR